ncbi:histidine kinase [Sandaracinobacter sp. RS1-74]|uniref:sensor histidine kinase n=1 Tax=Sandaracinobacteroides sayramensis TaxID=2913411 RepID=UPI001EDA9BD2|nr:histidine kinase [Sandaracinobacteroides sayramensis]MCG2842830.1 histidine kinase [Sandaracinobacteroides sayramensis]
MAKAAPPAANTPASAPRGFFADKNRAFWTLQIVGWTGYFLLRSLGGLANRMGISFILPTILIAITGFSITLLMGWAYRAVIRMKPVWVWSLSVIILVVGSVLFSAIEVWAHATFYEPGWQPQGIEFFGAILLTLAVLGAWTGLYYGINYYLLLDAQAERFERMAAQASSAQLEMLRYQINPHFLFNTLNSISTLVLLAETEKANTMLSRLSSFLRYSLVGEREGQATVAQEMQALKLYLEIERTRFEERLRTRFDIASDVTNARIPSLLLQPLVENAVKYAVTPLEEGADIWVTARRLGDRLELMVADTGPGVGDSRPTPEGTGVGLTNIRERLVQAYGDDHSFEIQPNGNSPLVQAGKAKGPGVLVRIEIPLQFVSSADAAQPDVLAGAGYEVLT